jgi:D-glucosaminate PTS system EIID component
MGPFAGVGDALLPGTFIPILLAIGCGLSKDGSVLGAILYMIVFLGVMIPLTWFLFKKGCELGASAAELILGNDLKDDVVEALNTVGLVVVGTVSAQYAAFNIGWKYVEDGVTLVDLGALIDGVWPKLPVYLLALFTYWLMAKKNWSATKVILLYLIIAIVGYFTGVLV